MTMLLEKRKVGRKSKIEKEKVESKTLKRMVLKDIASGNAVQICLESYKAPEILDLVEPTKAMIEHCELGFRFREPRVKIETPKKLSELGSIYHRMGGKEETIELRMTQVSVKEVREVLGKVSAHYGKKPSDFYVSKLRLNKDGATVVFKYTLKDIPKNHDKRTKVRVLALLKINRDPELESKAKTLLSSFSLAKYVCKFHAEERKVAICSKLEE